MSRADDIARWRANLHDERDLSITDYQLEDARLVDDGNRAAFNEAESFPPLNYKKQGEIIDLSFWRAPERLFDEPEELVAWARAALAAARRVAAKRERTGPKRKSKPRPGSRLS